jgi:hypothetical protein
VVGGASGILGVWVAVAGSVAGQISLELVLVRWSTNLMWDKQ